MPQTQALKDFFNGVMMSFTPTSDSILSIRKPLSAITLSPGLSSCRSCDFFVISMSETEPVYSVETNVTTPRGATPIR